MLSKQLIICQLSFRRRSRRNLLFCFPSRCSSAWYLRYPTLTHCRKKENSYSFLSLPLSMHASSTRGPSCRLCPGLILTCETFLLSGHLGIFTIGSSYLRK